MKLILVIICLFGLAACATLPEPRLESVPVSAAQQALLDQTRELFSIGDYAQARRRAQQVLDANPDSADALFAVAATHFAMNEFAETVAASRRAARYRSALLPDIYLLAGAAYERLDDPWNALRTYRHASRRYPDNALAHYRLALIYIHLEKPELAGDSLKKVLRLDPRNPNPHYQLGMLYADHGYRIPALLALGTALVLNPREGPAERIHQGIDALLAPDSASAGAAGTDEGDFAAVDAALARASAALRARGVAAATPDMLDGQYRALFGALQALPVERDARRFAAHFYLPFYRSVRERGLEDAFIRRIFAARDDDAFARWRAQHPASDAPLEALLRAHRWGHAAAPEP